MKMSVGSLIVTKNAIKHFVAYFQVLAGHLVWIFLFKLCRSGPISSCSSTNELELFAVFLPGVPGMAFVQPL